MDCPMCSKEYDLSKIEEHVEMCLSMENPTAKTAPSQQTKRTMDFEDSEKNEKKRLKIGDCTQSTSKVESDRNIGFLRPSNIGDLSRNNLSNKVERQRGCMAIDNEIKKETGLSRATRDRNNPEGIKDENDKTHVPLAEKLRPSTLSSYVGQEKLLGPRSVLRKLLDNREVPSMILWGPPGCGKTSLANVIAEITKENSEKKMQFAKLSATTSGIKDIREAVSNAAKELEYGCRTIVFMDEIHRFNKLQQDIFLPHVEAGTFVLIGATTENPSFGLNSALLSRCRVFVLEKLTATDIFAIIEKALEFLGGGLRRTKELEAECDSKSTTGEPRFTMDEEAALWLAETCDGDARVALNGLEIAMKHKIPASGKYSTATKTWRLRIEDVKAGVKNTHTLSDRKCDLNYNVISAMQRSIVAGDANASLYWLARLMAGGEDPVYIARRLIEVASKHVGLDDSEALDIAVETLNACQMIGMPECDVMLGQCAIYLARATKSRLVNDALKKAQSTIMEHKGPQPSVPLHMRDREGERKLQASLGPGRVHLVRKKAEDRSRLPAELDDHNFFN